MPDARSNSCPLQKPVVGDTPSKLVISLGTNESPMILKAAIARAILAIFGLLGSAGDS
jgi:hypothetical protein